MVVISLREMEDQMMGDETGHHGAIGTPDYWVVKLNSAGIIQWQKSLGEQVMILHIPFRRLQMEVILSLENQIQVTVMLVERYGRFQWLCFLGLKLDAVGSIQWQKCLGGSGTESARSIKQTNDGGYVVTGYTSSVDGDVSGNHGNNDYWVVKLGIGGALQWQKCRW